MLQRRFLPVCVISAWILIVSGCCPPAPTPDPTDEELREAYARAVQDAATVEPDEIDQKLTPIVRYHDGLIWKDEPGSSSVLVVTWTSYTGYNDKVGQTIQATRDIWVTVSPEVQEFCQSEKPSPEHLTLRLEELLGVPPHNGKTTFVEFWVNPSDLFRPSPDPEITDREAELDFPQAAGAMAISDWYTQWFETLLATSYGENGYPWTRLGYTYDWGNPKTKIGLSEYVIRQGAMVEIHRVAGTEDYCRWW